MPIFLLAEIVVDREAGESTDLDSLAEQVDEEFLPPTGQVFYVTGEEAESSFVIKSTRVWAATEEEASAAREAASRMSTPEMSMSDQH
jgi:hypothetical protein